MNSPPTQDTNTTAMVSQPATRSPSPRASPVEPHVHGDDEEELTIQDGERYLYQRLKRQIEFYFSKQNLATDTFLQEYLSNPAHPNAVPVATICSFPKVRSIYASFIAGRFVHSSQAATANPVVVGAAMLTSSVVQVANEGHWFVRLPQADDDDDKMKGGSMGTTPTATPTSFSSGPSPAFGGPNHLQAHGSNGMGEPQQQPPVAFGNAVPTTTYTTPLPSVNIRPKYESRGPSPVQQPQQQSPPPLQGYVAGMPFSPNYPAYHQNMSGSYGGNSHFIPTMNGGPVMHNYTTPTKSTMQGHGGSAPFHTVPQAAMYGAPVVGSYCSPPMYPQPPMHQAMLAGPPPHASSGYPMRDSASVQSHEHSYHGPLPPFVPVFPAYVDTANPENVSFYDGASWTNEQRHCQHQVPPQPRRHSGNHMNKRQYDSNYADHNYNNSYNHMYCQHQSHDGDNHEPFNDSCYWYPHDSLQALHGNGTDWNKSFNMSSGALDYQFNDSSGGDYGHDSYMGGDQPTESYRLRKFKPRYSHSNGHIHMNHDARRQWEQQSQNSGHRSRGGSHAGSKAGRSRQSNPGSKNLKKSVLHDSSNSGSRMHGSHGTQPGYSSLNHAAAPFGMGGMGGHMNASVPHEGTGVPSVVLVSSPMRDDVSHANAPPPSEQATALASRGSTLPKNAAKRDEVTEDANTLDVGANRGDSPTSSALSQMETMEETGAFVEIDGPSFDTNGDVASATTCANQGSPPGQKHGRTKARKKTKKTKMAALLKDKQQVQAVPSKSPPSIKDESFDSGTTKGSVSLAQGKSGSALTTKKTASSNVDESSRRKTEGQHAAATASILPTSVSPDKPSAKPASSSSDRHVKQRHPELERVQPTQTDMVAEVVMATPHNRSQRKKKNQAINRPLWINDHQKLKNASDSPKFPFESPGKAVETTSQCPDASVAREPEKNKKSAKTDAKPTKNDASGTSTASAAKQEKLESLAKGNT